MRFPYLMSWQAWTVAMSPSFNRRLFRATRGGNGVSDLSILMMSWIGRVGLTMSWIGGRGTDPC